MNELRNLPRYNVLHLRPKIKFPGLEQISLFSKDISLGGIQIYSKDRFTLKSFNEIEFQLGKQEPIPLNVHQVWTEENPLFNEEYRPILKEDFEELSFRTGLRLKFYDQVALNNWMKFLYALHNIQIQKDYPKS